MSMYRCEVCDETKDSDFREIQEYKNGLACEEHFCEETEELLEECLCAQCKENKEWKKTKRAALGF